MPREGPTPGNCGIPASTIPHYGLVLVYSKVHTDWSCYSTIISTLRGRYGSHNWYFTRHRGRKRRATYTTQFKTFFHLYKINHANPQPGRTIFTNRIPTDGHAADFYLRDRRQPTTNYGNRPAFCNASIPCKTRCGTRGLQNGWCDTDWHLIYDSETPNFLSYFLLCILRPRALYVTKVIPWLFLGFRRT